ncbi:MAG: hypothetical protein AABZ53_08845 [Planctomycetota bacterium]
MADAGEQGPQGTSGAAAAPRPRARRRGRRLLVWLGCVSLTVVGGWWITTRSFVTRWVLTSQISSRLGVPVEASSVTLGMDGTVAIRGARVLSADTTGEARTFARADLITCQARWWELWKSGGPQVREIDVEGLLLRVSQSVKDNSVNIPTFVSTGGGEIVLPLIHVRDGVIEVGEHDLPGGYRVLRSLPIAGDLQPDPATRSYSFALGQIGGVKSGAPLLLTGRWDSARLDARLTGLTLGEIDSSSVPESSRGLVGALALKGEMPTATFAYTFPVPGASTEDRLRGIEATIELVDVGVTLPFEGKSAEPGASRRPRMHHVGGRITVQGGRALATLKGRIEDLSYAVELNWNGVSVDSPFECVLVSKGFKLKEKPRLSPFLPDRVHEKLAMFSSPTGTLDSRVVVTRTKAGEDPAVNGTLEFKDGSASFVRFPYRFEAMSGLFEFDDTSLQIKRVDGTAPNGATIHVTGVISPLDEYAKVSLDFDMRNVPVDSTLEEGLGPRRRKIIDTLFCGEKYDELFARGLIASPEAHERLKSEAALAASVLTGLQGDGARAPADLLVQSRLDAQRAAKRAAAPVFELGGRGNVKMRLESAYGKDMPWVQLIDIEIPKAGMVPRKFPVAVVARDVKLRIDDTVLSVVGGHFATIRGGDATVTAKADFSSGGDGGDTEIGISAKGIPFDDILLNAIPARDRPLDSQEGPVNDGAQDGTAKPRTLGEALAAMRLKALGDAEVKIYDKNEGETTFTADVKWSGGSAQPGALAPGRVVLDAMVGDLLVDDAGLRLALSGNTLLAGSDRTGATDSGRFKLGLTAAFAADAAETFATNIKLEQFDSSLAIEDTVSIFSFEAGRKLGELRTEYSPSGRVDVETLVRSRAGSALDLTVGARLPEGFGLSYAPEHGADSPVGVRIGPAAGAIVVRGTDDLRVSFDALRGPLTVEGADAGVLALDGTLRIGEGSTRGQASLVESLHIGFERARFESALTRLIVHERLGKQFAGFYEERKPRGEFSLDMTLRRPQGEWGVEGVLSPTSLSTNAEGTDVVCPAASGLVRFKNSDGWFEKVTLTNPEWSCTLDGGWSLLADGSTGVNLLIDARSQGLPGSLRALLPGTIRTYATDLMLEASGEVTFHGIAIGLVYPPGETTGGPAVTAAGLIDFAGVSADLGVTVTKATGAVEFTSAVLSSGKSIFQLSATLDHGTVAGVRMRDVKALVLSGESPGQVLVPILTADCHGGRITGEADLRPEVAGNADGRKKFDTRIDLSGVELDGVLADLQEEEPPKGRKVVQSALIEGNVTLGGLVGDPASRRGRGQLIVGGGEVLSLPLLLPMIQVSNFQIPTGERLDTAKAGFLISGQTIAIDRVSVFSPEIELRGFGTVMWPDMALDLVFNSRAARRVPVLTSVIESIRNEFVTTRVRGTAKAPQVTLAPFRSATSAVGSLFGSEHERDKWMNEMERQSVRNTDRLRVVSPVEASEPVR